MALLDDLFGLGAMNPTPRGFNEAMLLDMFKQLPAMQGIQPKIAPAQAQAAPATTEGWEPVMSSLDVKTLPQVGMPYTAPPMMAPEPAPVQAPAPAPARAPQDFGPSFSDRITAFGKALQGQDPGNLDRVAETRNQTYDFLVRRGMSEADAKTMVNNPALLQQALPSIMGGKPGYQVQEIFDQQGRRQKVLLDPRTGQYKPFGGSQDANNDPNAATAEIREYNLAKQQGFGGSFLDFAAAKKAAGKPPIESLTTAEKAVDKAYGKEYESLIPGGGLADAQKGIAQLREVSRALKDPNGSNLAGPILGRLPDFITSFTNPEAIAKREAVEEVVQRNLRAVLGAQFTQKEGDRLISRAYNPALNEAENAKRVDRLLASIEKAVESKIAAADYFERNGTLKGFKGTSQFTVDDFIAELDRPDPAPTKTAPKAAPEAPKAGAAPVQGARQAGDGNWYVPDPNRPGKYLRVNPSAPATGGELF